MLLAALGGGAGLLLTQEPNTVTVVVLIVCLSVAVAAIASLLLLSRTRPRGRDRGGSRTRVLRAARRAVEAGAAIGLIATLQIVHGLTPLTALFIVLTFAAAEYALSAGTAPSR